MHDQVSDVEEKVRKESEKKVSKLLSVIEEMKNEDGKSISKDFEEKRQENVCDIKAGIVGEIGQTESKVE